MNLYAVLLDTMGAACFTVAVSEILIYLRRKNRNFSLSFGMTSLFSCFFCLMCAGAYNVSSPELSVPWLRAEAIALNLMGFSLLWTISDATGMVPKGAMRFFAVWFAVSAVAQVLPLGNLTWVTDSPIVRDVALPFGLRITYREVKPGPLIAVQGVIGAALFVYLFRILSKFRSAGHPKEARFFQIVIAALGATCLSDAAVSTGLYSIPYLTEYSWLAVIFLVGFLRSSEVLESSEVKAALAETEEKFRTFIEQSSEAIFLADENGIVIEYNQAAEELSGVRAEEAIGSRAGELMERLFSDRDESLTRDADLSPLAFDPKAGGPVRELRRTDGTARYYRQNYFPIRTKAGYRLGSIIHDVTELQLSNETLASSLREKTVLLKEIHHRVKNNLQVISSLLFLQAKKSTDAVYREVLQDCRNQILSMSMIYENLYRSEDLMHVDFGKYVRKYVGRLLANFRATDRVSLDAAIDGIALSIDKAIPSALIVNELCTNALKHAFPKDSAVEHPRITIRAMETENGTVRLEVLDNGIGLPENFRLDDTASLGMRIVGELTRQLHGTISLERDSGTGFILEFPKADADGGEDRRSAKE